MSSVKSDRGGQNLAPSENKHTNEDLKIMQSWDLDRKIQVTKTRLIEWYTKWDGKCYVSFSGGKDSTVLAYLAAQVCEMLNYKLVLWFSDTGLEYPEVRQHVKTYGDWLKERFHLEVETVIDYPRYGKDDKERGKKKGDRITFREVIEKYGYPIISKEIAGVIKDARSAIANNKEDISYAIRMLNHAYINPKTGEVSEMYDKQKWKFLLDADFKISNYCCKVMKKQPAHRFGKSRGLVPIIGSMTTESRQRKTQWLKFGCNAFDSKDPSSKPISFWTEQDILKFILDFSIPIPSVYGEVKSNDKGKLYTTGCDRTGCMFCGFGCHLEKEPNRFQRLKQTHPKVWEYCMKPVEDGGLGMRKVLEYINVKCE